MSMDVTRAPARNAARAGSISHWLPLLLIFAAGVLLRNVVVANTDVSWLVTLCEKMLAGERPYVDFIETNPPASILLYMLPVMFARATGIAAEVSVDIFVFCSIGLSLWLSGAILRASGLFSREVIFQLAALFAAAFVLLPSHSFGEREHIAIITFLPLLALCVVRAEGKVPAIAFVLAAAIGSGVTAIIKPHFIFAIVFVAAVAAHRARSWRVFFALEHWIAGAMLAVYAAGVYLLYPEFVATTLPLVAEIYVPVTAPLWKFLIHFATPIYLGIFIVIWLLKGREALRAPFLLLLAASLGFSISYYGQLKGWAYHSYPMLAFALIAAAIAFAQRWPRTSKNEAAGEKRKRLASAFAIAFLAGATFVWMNFALDMRSLREPIARSVTKPKVIAITSDIAIGHPLTRALNGIWVGRVCSQWIATGAKVLRLQTTDPSLRKRYDELEAYDLRLLIEDIQRGKPDIILVDRIRYDWLEWAMSKPALARELENYRKLDEILDVVILRRK